MFSPDNRYFEVKPPSPWPTETIKKPQIDNDELKKKEFGVELAKGLKPFDAGLEICGNNTADAVWISLNWLSDPIVLAARDTYSKLVELETPLLDKNQFAARLLKVSEEKDEETGRYLIDAKDRLKALELYGKTQGFIDKPEDHSNKTFVNNGLTIKIVKSENQNEEKIIDLAPEKAGLEPSVSNALPLKLKLVGT